MLLRYLTPKLRPNSHKYGLHLTVTTVTFLQISKLTTTKTHVDTGIVQKHIYYDSISTNTSTGPLYKNTKS